MEAVLRGGGGNPMSTHVHEILHLLPLHAGLELALLGRCESRLAMGDVVSESILGGWHRMEGGRVTYWSIPLIVAGGSRMIDASRSLSYSEDDGDDDDGKCVSEDACGYSLQQI